MRFVGFVGVLLAHVFDDFVQLQICDCLPNSNSRNLNRFEDFTLCLRNKRNEKAIKHDW